MHTPGPRGTQKVWEGGNHVLGKLNTQGRCSRHCWALDHETGQGQPSNATLGCWGRGARASARWQVLRVQMGCPGHWSSA